MWAKVIDIFINQILGQAPFLMGIICFIGYLLLKRGISTAITGFIKAFVGFKILQVGTGGLTTTFSPILKALKEHYGMEGAIMDSYVPMSGALDKLGEASAYVGYALLIGFAWNIALVACSRFSKIRTLQVTGHVMYVQSAILLWMVYFNLDSVTWINIVVAGILVGTYWSVFSNLTLDCTNDLTGGANFAIGHQQMFGIWLTSKLAPKLGSRDSAIENLKFPKFLELFNDNIVASTILMTAFFGSIMAVIGSSHFETNLVFPLFVFSTCAQFAVYLSVILYGVRMFTSELVESFNGISMKLLPGSAPAVDIATVYGFGHPNATLVGFIAGAFGQLIGLVLLMLVFRSPILLIPGFIPMFFDNAGIGVYANHYGGLRPAMILPFISGVLQVTLGAVAYSLSGLSGGVMANFDWVTVIPGFMIVMRYGGLIATVIMIIILLMIPQLQYHNNKKYQSQEL